jgi:multisubunit Na+/H+ antiporter MnhB subunit
MSRMRKLNLIALVVGAAVLATAGAALSQSGFGYVSPYYWRKAMPFPSTWGNPRWNWSPWRYRGLP